MTPHYQTFPVEQIRIALSYDPETGVCRWLRRAPTNSSDRSFNSQFAGKVAGSICKNGYRSMTITHNGVEYKIAAHILAWAHFYGEWPNDDIDHEDRDRDHNAITNLRSASASENLANQNLRSDNTSGFKGVSRSHDKWCANINFDGKRFYLGQFADARSAALAYDNAAAKYHGKFARTNTSLGLL